MVGKLVGKAEPQNERRIEPLDMATPAMLGFAPRGPTWPQPVHNWQDFVHWYGRHAPDAHLAYAVEGFFRNGGRRCYIVRVTGFGARFAEVELGPLRVRAIGPGSWGNRVAVRLRQTGEARMRLTARYWEDDPPADIGAPRPSIVPTGEETFDHLNLDPASPDYVLTRLAKGQSRLVMVEWIEGQRRSMPKTRDFALLRGGLDGGVPTAADFVGQAHASPHLCRGLSNLRDVPDVGLVCVAEDVWDEAVQLALVGHCSDPALGRLAILTSPRDAETPEQIHPAASTAFAAHYYPWLEVLDPITYAPRLIPPVGHIAAIFARVDRQHGIYYPPANELVSGILGVQRFVTADDHELLASRRINVIRDLTFARKGIVVWSALTLADDTRWRYVHVRRFANMILRSIATHTRWVLGQDNAPPLWAEVESSVREFLDRLWREGSLKGGTPDQAYAVRCDRTTMTASDIGAGRVIAQVGFAPLRAGELYLFQVIQSPQGMRIIEV